MQKSFYERLRKFDAYPKTLEDFQIKTFSGATVTVIACGLIMLLVVTELYDFIKPEVTEDLFVDTTRGAKLKINLDIVFQRIPCDLLSLDAQDLSGEQHVNIQHNIFKRPLNLDGTPKSEPTRQETVGPLNGTDTKNEPELSSNKNVPETTTIPACGSCYGAEAPHRKCCNTCNDIMDAYRAKGWATPTPQKFEQCKREGVSSSLRQFKDEGCQIYGYLLVNRVGGNFHISPGNSFQANHVHVHDFQNYDVDAIDMTHTVRHLSFGEIGVVSSSATNPDDHAVAPTAPLDGYAHSTDSGLKSIHYYLKIVPSMYQRLDGSTFSTNQFSVTHHEKNQRSILDSGVPGVFFSYELSPMMVKYTEHTRSIGQFLTSLCAIIGGVFTVAGLIDAAIYHSSKALQQKLNLGKAT